MNLSDEFFSFSDESQVSDVDSRDLGVQFAGKFCFSQGWDGSAALEVPIT